PCVRIAWPDTPTLPLPRRNPGLPGFRTMMRKSGKPDLRRGRMRAGAWFQASGRLEQRVLAICKRPIEPKRQRLEIGALYGRATPDAQSEWSIAVRIDIIGYSLLLERRAQPLHEIRLCIRRQFRDRRIHDLEAHRRVRANGLVRSEEFDPGRAHHPI